MREVILRPEAEADIEEIADYTITQWGREKAIEYVEDLRRTIEALAGAALHHPLLDRVYPGLRRIRCAMHHIYYLAFDDRVEIVRIMHVKSDPGRHLHLEAWRNWE